MDRLNKVNVFYNGRKVGTLALYQKYLAAFEYDNEWLADGFSISPFSLPLQKGVFIPKRDPFEGVHGIFADCLPDGWGRLLVDRFLLSKGINPNEINTLDRLAIVGSSGMGALSFEPDKHIALAQSTMSLDELAEECSKVLRTDNSENLDELFRMGGSSGGARPKILPQVDGEDWIIKFPASEDKRNIGKQEYEYSLCAKACNIEMSETRLFPSKKCEGYFGTKRFDRVSSEQGLKRIHMATVSALLETSHRIPNLDYDILMKLTLELTKDYTEVEKMYCRMCFNVFAHNRDDHSKNFTFLYKEEEARWVLSPAYDLTFSYSLGGEHATTVHGEGKSPGMTHLLKVADGIGLSKRFAEKTAKDIEEKVKEWQLISKHK